MSKLGEQLRALRKTHGWTQKRLAHSAGISQAYLCQLECGRNVARPVNNPGAKTLLRLANAFQVPLDYFREAIEEDNNESVQR